MWHWHKTSQVGERCKQRPGDWYSGAWARTAGRSAVRMKLMWRQWGVRMGCLFPLWHWHSRVWLGSWLFSGAAAAIFEAGARLSTSIFVQSFSFWWVPGHMKSTSSPHTVTKPHTCIQNGVKKGEAKGNWFVCFSHFLGNTLSFYSGVTVKKTLPVIRSVRQWLCYTRYLGK